MFLKFYNKVTEGSPDTYVIECEAYTRSVYRDQESWEKYPIDFYSPFGLEYGAGDVEFPKDGITVFEIAREQDDIIDGMVISVIVAMVDFNLYVENINGKTVDRYAG